MTAVLSSQAPSSFNFHAIKSDPFEVGVEDDDLAIHVVKTSEGSTILQPDEMLNPFYVSINEKKLDDITGKYLHTMYKRCLALCVRDDVNTTITEQNKCVGIENIYKQVMTKTEYANLAQYYTLVSVSRNLLKIKKHYSQSLTVSKDLLTQFNATLVLEASEIVVPILELKESTVKMYDSIYESSVSVAQLPDMITLTNHYVETFRGPVQKNLVQLILNVKEADFWTNPYNCNINLTEPFASRGFQYKEVRDQHTKVSIIAKAHLTQDVEVNKVIDKLAKLNPKEGESDYLNHIHKKETYTDILNALQNSKTRTYFATSDLDNYGITKAQVTQLFTDMTVEADLFAVFNTLLISKDLCHMVLNNATVLTKMAPIIERHKPLYKYLFGYAWLCFYTEECIFKTKSSASNRFSFDIDVASKLPTFPFCAEDIYQNPYLVTLVSDKLLDAQNNCLSLHAVENHDGYGVTNLQEFITRFNIFTTGRPDVNMLDGINWEHFGVSGSIIPACLQKRSPLFDFVTNSSMSETDKWNTYFNQYYPTSDIDLMCNQKSVFKFIDETYNVINTVKKNLGLVNKKDPKDIPVEAEPLKSLTVVVNGKYLTERIEHIHEHTDTKMSVEEIIKNIGSENMREYFYKLYTDSKYESNRLFKKTYKPENNALYSDFYKPSSIDQMNITLVTYEMDKDMITEADSETCYYVNDFRSKDKQVPAKENIMILKICENIKFKLRSPFMRHTIEAFRVKAGGDFYGVVARFHLPCVRGYVTKNNDKWSVRMLPSCITAMMTGINMDYKYFAGTNDPIVILNKYRTRGFGTLLNATEKQHMIYYNANVNTPKDMFFVNSNDKQSVTKFFGAKEINDNIYKPLMYRDSLPADAYPVKQLKYIKTLADLREHYKTKYGYDINNNVINIFKLRTITPEGYVEPLNKWVIEAFTKTTKA